jgi:hypothetical protein
LKVEVVIMMHSTNKKLTFVSVIGLGALTFALLGLGASARAEQPQPGQPMADEAMSQTTHETVTVTAIDRTARSATLQNDQGEIKVVDVPQEVKAYDTLKVGDKIDIDYHEAVAISLLPKGAKPSMSESTSAQRMANGVGGKSKQVKVSAEIVSVDSKANKVTFKGPRGKTDTVKVTNSDMQSRLGELRPGQVVQVTYTEAWAAAIQPASPASSKMKP